MAALPATALRGLRKQLPALVLALAAVPAGQALAWSDLPKGQAAPDRPPSETEVLLSFALQGYHVRELDAGKSYYLVHAVDRQGRSIRARVDPRTGEILGLREDRR
jgi:hypothetical protein